MKIKFCLISIFLCVIFSTNSQSLLEEAKRLQNSKQFLEASVLYERIIFEPENEEQLSNAIIAKIECFKQQTKYAEAIDFIKKNIHHISSDSTKNEVYTQWVLCNYLFNQLDETISLIEQSKAYFPKYVNHRWLDFLKILSLNEQTKWVEAKQTYLQWLKTNNIDTAFVDIYNTIPKLKSENKAQWLSKFFPAGGILYAGKYGEAATSILLQAAGLYYAYSSYQIKYYLSAWLVGTGIAGSFYFGSSRRAETLIKEYNKRKTVLFNNQVKQQILKQMKENIN